MNAIEHQPKVMLDVWEDKSGWLAWRKDAMSRTHRLLLGEGLEVSFVIDDLNCLGKLDILLMVVVL
jgi:hypothetical protein